MGSAYAAALVDLAQDNNNLDAVHADVDALSTLLRESPDVKTFLDNPIISLEKKRNVIQSIGKEAGLNQDTITFMNLVLDKDRLMALEEICESFEKAYCRLTDTQVSAGPTCTHSVQGSGHLKPCTDHRVRGFSIGFVCLYQGCIGCLSSRRGWGRSAWSIAAHAIVSS